MYICRGIFSDFVHWNSQGVMVGRKKGKIVSPT